MKTDIPGWLIVDPQTGERCMWFRTRAEAREFAGDWGRVVRMH